ncbi:c-type cytochrome [Hymenobacter coccineus]|uniref:Cytochrome c domain-containing protein n=1 Tax=Hymenobacter coccineus TaxID=1908235 RepID=A0A1G1TGY5_9BACT|nr:cytochrome c [Hymenobacter coccineus]OGX90073.1 hypothetical protein BEN49_23940 [Hymenobacter coccineus]
MRTNSLSFALTVGMGLIVVLMCYAALSAAGLVGFAAADVAAAVQSEEVAINLKSSALKAKRTAGIVQAQASAKDALAIQAGDALFKANCTQCHAINEQVVGPALAGVTKRRTIAWIIPWVKNSAKVVASGDEYAVALYGKFQKQQMPSFQLSNEQIQDIVAYIDSQEGSGISEGSEDQAIAAK